MAPSGHITLQNGREVQSIKRRRSPKIKILIPKAGFMKILPQNKTIGITPCRVPTGHTIEKQDFPLKDGMIKTRLKRIKYFV
jgi:hypothetical protein